LSTLEFIVLFKKEQETVAKQHCKLAISSVTNEWGVLIGIEFDLEVT